MSETVAGPELPTDRGLTRKAALNTLASMLVYGARLVVGFVLTPLLVSGLNDYGYGVWQVLGRLIGYASPASGRPMQALKTTIANCQYSEDYPYKRLQVGNALAVLGLFLPLLLAIGAGLAWYAPVWLGATGGWVWIIRAAALLLVVDVTVTSIAEAPRAVLYGENQGYRCMGWSALVVVAGGALTAFALSMGFGLIGVAAATLATSVMTGLLFLYVTRRYVSWFGIARPTAKSVRQFFGLTGWFLLWSLLVKTMLSADVIILGIMNSPELVTHYTLTKYLPEVIINLVALFVFGITPGLGGIIGAGDMRKAIQVRNEIMLLTWLVLTVLGVSILLLNGAFLTLWVGAGYYSGNTVNLLIILVVMQFVLIRNDSAVIDLTLDLRLKVLIGLLSVALSIALAVLLIGVLDNAIVAVCVGFLLGRAMLTVSYPWLVGNTLGLPLKRQLRGVVRPALATAALFLAAMQLGPAISVNTWPGLVLAAAASALSTALLVFFVAMSGRQRLQVWQRFRRVLHLPG